MAGELHANCINCGKCQHPMDVDDISLFCMECAPNEAPCLKVCPEKAIEIITPYLAVANQYAVDLAKKYGQRPRKIGMLSYLR